MNHSQYSYIGQELDLFSHAKNWKRYWSAKLLPLLQGDVLEVGAGLGSNTSLLIRGGRVCSWTCVEPDPNLAERLQLGLAGRKETAGCRVVSGTTRSFESKPQFDSLIYIDVLEHIEADGQELETASHLLRPGGVLIVLSPAHQWLYTPFDRAIGHFRRYTRKTLTACTPADCRLEDMYFLDSCGMLVSLANRLLLKQSDPTLGQIRFWDTYVVPISIVLDRVLRFKLGKSIVGVWRKAPQSESEWREMSQ